MLLLADEDNDDVIESFWQKYFSVLQSFTIYYPQCYFESRYYGKRFNSIGKFKSLTFQLRAIYFHTFAVDMSV